LIQPVGAVLDRLRVQSLRIVATDAFQSEEIFPDGKPKDCCTETLSISARLPFRRFPENADLGLSAEADSLALDDNLF